MLISVITPVYHGRQYIPGLKRQLEECAGRTDAELEWILSNDDPEADIDPAEYSDSVKDGGRINGQGRICIKVLNTDTNRGIQGARVRGLLACSGEFVTFLDQDDNIRPEYFASQLKAIGDADAAVCSMTDGGKESYGVHNRPPLDVCITKEYNLGTRVGFFPGQVLIRKKSIPELWTRRHLKWNSCDDYYLWLCMYAEGRRFVLNPEILYDHALTGENQSLNTYATYKAMKEMTDILVSEKVFTKEDEEIFLNGRDKAIDFYFREKDIVKAKLELYGRLLSIAERNDKDLTVPEALAGKKIAVYGAELGIHLVRIMERCGNRPQCIIDRDAASLDLPVKTVTRENIPQDTELIVSTLLQDNKSVTTWLEEHYPNAKVVKLRDVLALLEE